MRHRFSRFPWFVLLCLPAAGQDPLPPASLQAFPPFRGLFVDVAGPDGVVWARGESYKAGFGRNGAQLVPIFGSRARSYPLGLQLVRAAHGAIDAPLHEPAVARASDTRVLLDHGGLIERWDLSPAALEQSFDVPQRLADGDLVLHVELTTDLAASVAGGMLVLDAPGVGRVEYRDAVAFDARGQRAPLTLDQRGTRIELRVPDAFLDRAAFPVVVDPTVSVFPVTTSTLDHDDPDLIYDQPADVWLVVCEEAVSATDRDIRCDRFRGDGTFLETVFFASTSADTTDPSIANNIAARRVLVAWQHANFGTVAVARRLRNPASSAPDSSTSSLANLSKRPVLGGDSSQTGNRWCLISETLSQPPTLAAQPFEIDGLGNLQGVAPVVTLDAQLTNCVGRAAVSRDRKGGSWVVAWSSRCSPGGTFFAAIDGGGTVQQAKTAMSSPGLDDHPSVAGDGAGQWVVAWERDLLVTKDVFGAIVQSTGGVFTASAPVDLTILEPSSNPTVDQTDPAIGFDGCRYVYAYAEGLRPPVRAATVRVVNGAFAFDEGHVALGSASGTGRAPAIATKADGAGGPVDSMICWGRVPLAGGNASIDAALYQGFAPGPQSQAVATACPTAGAPTISFSGAAVLGLAFTIKTTGMAGQPFLFVGGAAAVPLPLCAASGGGVCSLGLSPVVLSVPGTQMLLAVPCTPSLVGGQVGIQGIDLGASGGCTQFGVPFRVTDTVVVTVR